MLLIYYRIANTQRISPCGKFWHTIARLLWLSFFAYLNNRQLFNQINLLWQALSS
jgi:hypothetical protein